MKYIYYAIPVCVAIFFAYFIGVYVGNLKCSVRIENMNTRQIAINTNLSENINETVFHTTLGDIRRVLREKYTISE